MIKKTDLEKYVSKIAATKKYKENNKVFVAKKAKIRQETINLKAELLDSIIAQRLIPNESMTNFVKCGLYEIESMQKNLDILKANNKEGKI